jgi:P-type Cu2+ transporter
MNCTLCGLPSGESDFCCAGCRNVHAILVESGIAATGQDFRETEIFQRSLKLGLISTGAAESATPAIPESAETRETVFQLGGMWCTSCGWLIEHAIGKISGVRSADVVFTSDLLKVRYCPQFVPRERIVERVESLGYRAAEYTGETAPADRERKDLLLRTGIAAFLWMNVMTFSLVVYASYFEPVAGSIGRWVPFLLGALATPAVFYCAKPILRIAWAGLRAAQLRMETLLAMGILGAYGYSVVQAIRGDHHVYFDTVCAIVTLVLAGKAIEREAKQRALRTLTLLHRLMPSKARIVQDGKERFVAVEALAAGTVFRVKPGERVAADGIVVDGQSHVDESVLTGEAEPVAKRPGDPVVSGSVNTGGVLEVRATRVGAESTLARIVKIVEEAAARRTGIERAVDRVARVFIPAVLALAVGTFAFWTLRTGRVGDALMHAIAVVVIACPCALGIATPLALTAAVATAGRRRILVRDSRVLETIREIDTVVLDKTGTATFGEYGIRQIVGDDSRMAELAAVEAWSEHPIAKALAVRATGLAATDVHVYPGRGIAGTVDGRRYFLGNLALLDELDAVAADFPAMSGTVAYFGWDGAVRGTVSFGDRVRPEASALCLDLARRGIRTILLSGDTQAATASAAAEIGANEWIAEALPERKVEIVARLQGQGHVVAMIGDGVNDAPSLAQADLGIAMGSGTDIAIEAAPLVLMGRSLAAVSETLDLARRTMAIVRQNLFWAFLYNVIGISLAIAGVLNPILAAGAMVLSSASVIGNSRRLG